MILTVAQIIKRLQGMSNQSGWNGETAVFIEFEDGSREDVAISHGMMELVNNDEQNYIKIVVPSEPRKVAP